MKKVILSEALEGMFIEWVVRDYDAMISKHLHNEYEIYYLLEGDRYYFIDDKTYLVKRGSLVFIDKNQIHKTSTVSDPQHDRILLEIRGENFIPFMEKIGIDFVSFFRMNFGVLELSREEQKEVEDILFAITAELKEKRDNYEAIVKMKVAKLLVFAIRREKQSSYIHKVETAETNKHQKVHEVVEFIVKNYEEAQSLGDLSKRFYVSKSYLSRIFKEVTGFTVNEFINAQRIKQAKRLLVETDLNITEIADSLGYESITYFEKVFKRYTEISPLKYRKKQMMYLNQVREKAMDKV